MEELNHGGDLMKIEYFKNDKCSVCKAMLPKIQTIAKNFDIDIEVIDVIENPSYPAQKLVFTVPTVIILDEEFEIKRFARNFSISEVINTIERYLEISKK